MKIVISDKREVAGSCNPNSHRNRPSYHETWSRGGGSCILQKLPLLLQHTMTPRISKMRPLSPVAHYEPRNPAITASIAANNVSIGQAILRRRKVV